MKELLEKLSSYNVFNYLFPGTLFAVIGSIITPLKLTMQDHIYGLCIYYLYGLIVSRLGSLVIEPICKKLKIVKFAAYEEYAIACQKDPFVATLSEQNNMFRTLIALVLSLFSLRIMHWVYMQNAAIQKHGVTILLCCSFLLFLLSYRKQTSYIVKRVAKLNQ